MDFSEVDRELSAAMLQVLHNQAESCIHEQCGLWTQGREQHSNPSWNYKLSGTPQAPAWHGGDATPVRYASQNQTWAVPPYVQFGGSQAWMQPRSVPQQYLPVPAKPAEWRINQTHQIRESLRACAATPTQVRHQATAVSVGNHAIIRSKRKRQRTAFTTDQILVLEKVYATQPYVARKEREQLTQQLRIPDRAVKVWFQNRRMKAKKEALESEESLSTGSDEVSSVSSPGDSLEYVETQIHNTDQDGQVHLDSEALDTLVRAIDAHIPAGVDLLQILESPAPTEADVPDEHDVTLVPSSGPVYEPISPASSSVEPSDEWQPPTEDEELKRLFSLHFC